MAIVFTVLLIPASAGAGFIEGGRSSDVVSQRPADGVVGQLGFSDRPCIDKDFHEDADHHPDKDVDDIAEQAKSWERAASKAARSGDHEMAARRYEYAACLWDSISEFDQAEAAYEKAAEQYDAAAKEADEAGDAKKAAEMREKADRIRDLLD